MTATTFRIAPPDDRYPGITALSVGGSRELVCVGTGKAVEKVLREMKEGRG